MRIVPALTCIVPLFTFQLSAQRRAITIEDYIALKAVSDPQLSPDGKWVAYTVSTLSLQDNRNVARVWIAEGATGRSRELTGGPGSDRQPRWSPDGKTLAFISTREGGAQVWLLPIGGGDARKLSSLAEGASDPVWLPDGSGLLVVSDIKWPTEQEIDRRNGQYPTEARIWTELLWRHWDDFRAGKRQHVFRVDVATGKATDLTPVDHDVPTIATGGDGDVAVSPDGKIIAVAMHGDSTVADNTNVDIYFLGPGGGGGGGGGVGGSATLRPVTTGSGAENTPRFSPDGKWLSYLSMERAGFEAERLRLMLDGRTGGQTAGRPADATAGWDLSVGSYTWCPNSRCIYAVVEERGRDNIYRIDIPGYRRTRVISGGLNTAVQVGPDNRTLAYVHQSNTQPPEVWLAGNALSHQTDSAVARLDLPPLEEFGFVGALGDSVFGWMQKPPGFDASRKYPLIYLIHGGPQGAWSDSWGPRWNNQMFAARGFVVAEVNFHGSTGYGQKFTDAISQHWGDYPFEDLMKGLDVVARLPYVDSTRMGAAGASYGGYMILWTAGQTKRFKVLVDHDGVFNPVSMAGSTEELWFTDWEFGGTPYANRALFERWSPLNHVTAWKTPILVVHGQLDYRVDLSEGYQAFTAAKRMGVEAKFLYFPDEGHWVLRPRNRRIWWSTVLDWLEGHLHERAHP
jgi:dipeptidyl aminopeptidase/acylaminoacyl peptidase